MNDQQLSDIALYIIKLTDQEISPAEFEELDSVLSADTEAARYYNQLMMIICNFQECSDEIIVNKSSTDTLLQQKLWHQLAEIERTAPAIEISTPALQRELIQKVVYSPIKKVKISLFHKLTFVACAALILLMVYLHFTPRPVQQVVGRVSQSANARWLSQYGPVSQGSDLYPGPLVLREGFAQIELNSGVRVILESPVTVDLETTSRLFLDEGRLVVNIEQSSVERFVVRTPNSTIVDYGTQFGVEVEKTGQTNTHVFKGQVELRQGSDPLKFKNKLALQAGQSGCVNPSDELVRIAAMPQRFISVIPARYELAVKKTKPLYYWRFDSDKGGILKNEMEPGVNQESRLYGSLGSTNGPDLGVKKNTALRLTDRKEDYAILRRCTDEADSAEAFSVAMWIRPQKTTENNNRIMFVKLFSKHDIEPAGFGNRSTIGFTKSNQFTFDVFCSAKFPEQLSDEERAASSYRVASAPVQLGQWYHVVAAYTNSNQVNLYVNGQLEDTSRISADVKPVSPEMIWVVDSRRWDKADSAFESNVLENTFMCDIDEISQYNRQLSAADVRMLYKSAQGN
ncbi:MAG: FecR domain-containing protein [Sedimentisphaerales bacterium]|nr:FecR domain-containing protein [Sedimentisphaerales bacterium]